ncbi:hypothetical protein B0H16DRAFT_1249158, partial [Mycena metata]
IYFRRFFEPLPATPSFPIVAGVLRMSPKYEVDVLRRRALLHLSSQHPTTLDDWDALGQKYKGAYDEFLLELILLARQTSALWILPVAFYTTCTRVDPEVLVADANGHGLPATDVVACARGLRYLDTTATSAILDFLNPRPIPGCLLPEFCAQNRGAK